MRHHGLLLHFIGGRAGTLTQQNLLIQLEWLVSQLLGSSPPSPHHPSPEITAAHLRTALDVNAGHLNISTQSEDLKIGRLEAGERALWLETYRPGGKGSFLLGS